MSSVVEESKKSITGGAGVPVGVAVGVCVGGGVTPTLATSLTWDPFLPKPAKKYVVSCCGEN